MKDSHKSGFGAIGVIFCAFFTFAAMACAGTYSGGSGTAEDPYQISTIADWQELIAASADWDKQFVLLNDINFNRIQLTPVAPDEDSTLDGYQGVGFGGVFDGGKHILGGDFAIHQMGKDYVGLFGSVRGTIRNLTVYGSFRGEDSVGSIAGLCDYGSIVSCSVGAWVTSTNFIAGGLVGENRGFILSCSSDVDLYGVHQVGGLVGRNENGTIASSHSSCMIHSGFQSSIVGGLVGENFEGTIRASYATGHVFGQHQVGGLVGFNYQQIPDRSITHCYTDTYVGGESQIGGLVGLNEGSITECFAINTVSGGPQVGGLVGKNRRAIMDCWSGVSVNGGPMVGGLAGENEDGSIARCYAAGQVVGHENDIGALVGKSWYTFQLCHEVCDESGCRQECLPPEEREKMVEACFWNIDSVELSSSSGGGIALTSQQMKTLQPFIDAGWDFVGETINGMADVWRWDPLHRTTLQWQRSQYGSIASLGEVEWDDLFYLIQRWMASTPETAGAADTNGDNKVDYEDFGVLSEHFGTL